MAEQLRFDGRVAVITGAGGGLGRAHALLLASRGARILVNDLGGATSGGGQSSAAADKVVAEVQAAGGQAAANYDSVEDGKKIIQSALDAFGRLDIVINNAGILRDVSFQKMTEEDWERIYRVHVLGAFRVTQAAWPYLRDQGYGRILFTASAAGIYGNFGQANYSMAKLGLLGFANTLAIEGAKKNILVNTFAPVAGSRMTETVMPKELVDALKPEYVSPLVAYLCHESCEEKGALFEVGGGFVAKLRWQRAQGKTFKRGQALTPEAVRAAWDEIAHFEKVTYPSDIAASLQPVLDNLNSKSLGSNEFIDVDQALGHRMAPMYSTYNERDLSLYALGVGAGKDPLDKEGLRFVYERHPDGFQPLPTYGVVPALSAMFQNLADGKQAPGLNYGLDRVLHGEQYTELLRPLPTKAKLRHEAVIQNIFDKGKMALVITAITTYNEETNEPLVKNEITTVVRGAGGFGGERGPSQEINVPPARPPDAVVTEKTGEDQALLYRLSGDWNPLHADPGFASSFGFPRPILHGLCTFGYAGRHALQAFANNDSRLFKSIKARFAESVFPGDTLRTEMWKEGGRIILRCRVVERDKVVISNAAVELHAEVPQPRTEPAASPRLDAATPPAASLAAGPTSADVFAAIGAYLTKNPELSGKVNTLYVFKLKSPDSAWTVNLKVSPGQVTSGASEKADCTLELSESDFLDMTGGRADPNKLYFGGKMKISGNVMASQKLEFLKKIDPASVKPSGAPPPAEAPKGSEEKAQSKPSQAPTVFAALRERLAKTPGLIAETNAVIHFHLTQPESHWTVDLKTAPGSVTDSQHPEATTTLRLSEETLLALVKDVHSAQALYMQGKLRVDGDLQVAKHLGFLEHLV